MPPEALALLGLVNLRKDEEDESDPPPAKKAKVRGAPLHHTLAASSLGCQGSQCIGSSDTEAEAAAAYGVHIFPVAPVKAAPFVHFCLGLPRLLQSSDPP